MEDDSTNSKRPADDPSPPDPPAQDDPERHIQDLPAQSFAFLPPHILAKFFAYLSMKDRLRCAGVSQSWRTELTQMSSNWRDVCLGRNAVCYDAAPPHAADFLPLPHVEQVVFKARVPFVLKEQSKSFRFPDDSPDSSIEYQITKLPLARLRLILNRCSNLRKLDMSEMWLGRENAAAFRALWFGCAELSQLTDLRLPMGFYSSSSLLKKIATRHPKIEHLTLSTPFERLTTDVCENPFHVFKDLKSLTLWPGLNTYGEVRVAEQGDRTVPGVRSDPMFAAALDTLQIQSLELAGVNAGVIGHDHEQSSQSPQSCFHASAY